MREEGKAVLKQISQRRGIVGTSSSNLSVDGILCGRQQQPSASMSVGGSGIKKTLDSSTESQSNMDTEEPPPLSVGPIKLNFSPNHDESDTSNLM